MPFIELHAGQKHPHVYAASYRNIFAQQSDLIKQASILPQTPVMLLQKTAELSILQQLQNSELSLKQSQEIAGMGSWEWNALTNTAKWSENIFALYEIDPLVIEPSYEYVLSRLHPDDVPLMMRTHEIMQKTKSQIDTEVRVMFPDGRMKWFLNRMIPTFNGEGLIALKGINLDITQRKAAEAELVRLNEELEKKVIERTKEIREREQQYHLLLETMNEGVLYVDNNDRIILANQHFCEMMGYTLHELLGKVATEVFLDEAGQNGVRSLNAARGTDIIGCYEIQMKKQSGEKIWVQVNSSPVHNAAGEIVGSVRTHTDISQLVQQVRGMEDVILAISHHVRPPIANIMGLASLLEKGTRNGQEVKRIISRMIDSVSTLDLFTKRLTLLLSENKYIALRYRNSSEDPLIQHAMDHGVRGKWGYYVQPKRTDILQRGKCDPKTGAKEVFFRNGTAIGTFFKKETY